MMEASVSPGPDQGNPFVSPRDVESHILQRFTEPRGVSAFGSFGSGRESFAPMAAMISATRVTSFAETTSTIAMGAADAWMQAKRQGNSRNFGREYGNQTPGHDGTCLKCISWGATAGSS